MIRGPLNVPRARAGRKAEVVDDRGRLGEQQAMPAQIAAQLAWCSPIRGRRAAC
jgi:hypothetical protein